jgi:hypothetical protein
METSASFEARYAPSLYPTRSARVPELSDFQGADGATIRGKATVVVADVRSDPVI